ncbi:hypothetical protein H5410_027075 [Solanum commersonii]|uniref:Uncharacterized protein n=1 Tax=Solanum commersonii TaxID=4109 RepID=A0A9J5Z0X6_SOLCO|nr:hypothetical protein H5410_027075 [Solanum commersonii]
MTEGTTLEVPESQGAGVGKDASAVAPNSSHLGVLSDISGASHFFMFSKIVVLILWIQLASSLIGVDKEQSRRLLASHRLSSVTSSFSPKVTKSNFKYSMKLKAIWGTSANRQVFQPAQPSSPTDLTCLLSI